MTPDQSRDDEQPWQIVLPREQFARVRDDARLIPLLRLARIANALTIGQEGVLHSADDVSPAAQRRRWASFLYLGALLHEGLRTAEGLGRSLHHLPAYRAGFAALQGDKRVQWLRRAFLDKMRDRTAFHVDEAVYREALAHLDERDEVVFASGTTYIAGDIYFNLADDLAVEYLLDVALQHAADAPEPEPPVDASDLGDDWPPGPRAQMMVRLMMETSELSNRFIEATHRLIPVALREMGWKKRSAPPP
jgi:hypothetical protein